MGIAGKIIKGVVAVAATAVVGKLTKVHVIDRPKMTYSKEEYEKAERKLAGIRKELRRTRITLSELRKNDSAKDIYKKTKNQEDKLVKEEFYYEEIVNTYKEELQRLEDYKTYHRIF